MTAQINPSNSEHNPHSQATNIVDLYMDDHALCELPQSQRCQVVDFPDVEKIPQGLSQPAGNNALRPTVAQPDDQSARDQANEIAQQALQQRLFERQRARSKVACQEFRRRYPTQESIAVLVHTARREVFFADRLRVLGISGRLLSWFCDRWRIIDATRQNRKGSHHD